MAGGDVPVKSLQTAAAISITASLTHVTQLVTGETTATASRPPETHSLTPPRMKHLPADASGRVRLRLSPEPQNRSRNNKCLFGSTPGLTDADVHVQNLQPPGGSCLRDQFMSSHLKWFFSFLDAPRTKNN